jgi:hypothetical protein
MHARLTSRAVIAITLLAAAVVACGEAPPVRLVPEPAPRQWEGVVQATAEEEALAFERLEPLIPPLLERVWGLPPDSVRWSAGVYVRGLLDTASAQCFDTTVAPSRRERTRFNFCRNVEAALHPTDSARAPGQMHRRGVGIGLLDIRNDTLFVSVGVGAELPCRDGTSAHASVDLQYHFLRQRDGGWELATERPASVGVTSPPGPGMTCFPKALVDLWDVWRDPNAPWPPPPEPGTASTMPGPIR